MIIVSDWYASKANHHIEMTFGISPIFFDRNHLLLHFEFLL